MVCLCTIHVWPQTYIYLPLNQQIIYTRNLVRRGHPHVYIRTRTNGTGKDIAHAFPNLFYVENYSLHHIAWLVWTHFVAFSCIGPTKPAWGTGTRNRRLILVFALRFIYCPTFAFSPYCQRLKGLSYLMRYPHRQDNKNRKSRLT